MYFQGLLASLQSKAESESSEAGCFEFPKNLKNLAYFNVSDLDMSERFVYINLTHRTLGDICGYSIKGFHYKINVHMFLQRISYIQCCFGKSVHTISAKLWRTLIDSPYRTTKTCVEKKCIYSYNYLNMPCLVLYSFLLRVR